VLARRTSSTRSAGAEHTPAPAAGVRHAPAANSSPRPQNSCIVLHQVGWDGDDWLTQFSVTLGSAAVACNQRSTSTQPFDAGSFDHVRVEPGNRGPEAEAFRASSQLSRPRPASRTIERSETGGIKTTSTTPRG
jgi:hypothetical protein